LVINYSPITTLEGVRFPPNLGSLMLTGNKITSLKGITFPNTLSALYLDGNQITSFEGMKFPLSLALINLARNPIDLATVNLLERPTKAVKRAIIRDYPETAQYFEAQGEIKEVAMRNLQNHVRSIAQFLQPLIAERKKAKEEANLTEGKLRVFVNTPNGVQYTIPFTRTLTIQEGAIDYLERNYLLSVMNSWDKVDIIYRDAILDPNSTFAQSNIESEATLNLTGRKLSYQGGRKKTKYNRLKIKKYRSRKHK
jgi:Leucine-rich repeat (LRR) protein